MRALIVAASLFAAMPLLSRAGALDADWRQARLPAAMRDALRGEGYGLQDDGRVLDPKSRKPLSASELAAALARIHLSAQRLSLERLRLILGREPLGDSDRAAAAALKGNLPDEVARALDSKASLVDLRALADRDLQAIAAYFDGARTPAERAEAAAPVLAGDPGPRAAFPSLEASERRLSDALRAAAAARIARDPYGLAEVLARLKGADGKPELPAIVVENLSGDVARYDYRRRALIVDRDFLAASVADGFPAKERGALAKRLAPREGLIGYLNDHPRAVAAFAAQNEPLLVHELTHAWQDRRDPIMREMSRGTLPAALVVDYEEEAGLAKNLYLRSKLKHDPASVADDIELADFRKMTADPAGWLRDLRAGYAEAASNAMDLATARDIQQLRLEAARARPVAGRDEQNAKALDLLALSRADQELARAIGEERARVSALLDAIRSGQDADCALLAEYYLRSARDAPNEVEFSVRVRKAGNYAAKSGDDGLVAQVRALRESRR